MSEYSTFTSESVSDGHPDKLADRISDGVLDAILTEDPEARVACETLIKSGYIVIAGEIRTCATVDYANIAREVIRSTGYIDADMGMDPNCEIVEKIVSQSKDIQKGVDAGTDKEQGAGDQGMMFGYASNETGVFMPAPITYAHRLMERHAEVRRQSSSILLPDAKCQLTFSYHMGRPIAINKVVFSAQHRRGTTREQVYEEVLETIIKPELPPEWINSDTEYLINPAGDFHCGGPKADCGLTGRKIIVDTYGGMARHGGGAFSGKDPSKVDRSAAYAMRYVAKNVVAAGLAARCEVQVSYAIGCATPTSIEVNTFDTEIVHPNEIVELIKKNFKLKPEEIISALDLKRPIYSATAAFGHFGRELEDFTWEKTDKIHALQTQGQI